MRSAGSIRHDLAENIEGGGVFDNLQTTLEIGQDGRAGGHGGCNYYGGEVTIDGDKVSFGTLMAGAEAGMNQEDKFHDAPGPVVAFRIEQDQRKLLLLGADRNTLIQLAANRGLRPRRSARSAGGARASRAPATSPANGIIASPAAPA